MEFQPLPCDNDFFESLSLLNIISEGCIFNYLTWEISEWKYILKSAAPACVYFWRFFQVSVSTSTDCWV